jgi:hypothetical protein
MNPKTPQQKQYQRVRQKKDDLQKVVNEAAKYAEREWLARNPDYKDLAVKRMNIAYVKNKKGVSKGIIEIAKWLPLPGYAYKTNVEILQEMAKVFPQYELTPNVWSKTLSPGMLKRVYEAVRCNSNKPYNLKGCKTLSKIKKRIKAFHDSEADKPYIFKPTIVVTGETVVINNTSYPLIVRQAKGVEYLCIRVPVKGKRCWLRVDALITVLKKK